MIIQSKIVDLNPADIDAINGGGATIGAAALGAAAGVGAVAVASFAIGLDIGRSIGKAMFSHL